MYGGEILCEGGLTMTKWLAIVGIIAGLAGFFWQPLVMGIAAIVLGGFGQYTAKTADSTATPVEQKLNWVAIAAGAVALALYFIK